MSTLYQGVIVDQTPGSSLRISTWAPDVREAAKSSPTPITFFDSREDFDKLFSRVGNSPYKPTINHVLEADGFAYILTEDQLCRTAFMESLAVLCARKGRVFSSVALPDEPLDALQYSQISPSSTLAKADRDNADNATPSGSPFESAVQKIREAIPSTHAGSANVENRGNSVAPRPETHAPSNEIKPRRPGLRERKDINTKTIDDLAQHKIESRDARIRVLEKLLRKARQDRTEAIDQWKDMLEELSQSYEQRNWRDTVMGDLEAEIAGLRAQVDTQPAVEGELELQMQTALDERDEVNRRFESLKERYQQLSDLFEEHARHAEEGVRLKKRMDDLLLGHKRGVDPQREDGEGKRQRVV